MTLETIMSVVVVTFITTFVVDAIKAGIRKARLQGKKATIHHHQQSLIDLNNQMVELIKEHTEGRINEDKFNREIDKRKERMNNIIDTIAYIAGEEPII
jgi:hypothetical protein